MSTQETAASRDNPLARLEQIWQELARERRRVTRSSVVSLLLGIVLLGAITAYFVYGYIQLRELARPDALVDLAEDQLQKYIPEWQKTAKDEVAKNAPKWAADLSKQALENLPIGRKRLEEYALEKYDEGANEVIHLTDDQFRAYIRGNRPMLEKYFQALSKNQRLADEEIAELARTIEEQLQVDMKTGARQLLDTLIDANQRMVKLRSNQKLSPEEQNERRVVMLARRIQLESLEPAKLSQLAEPLPPRLSPTGRPRPAPVAKDKAAAAPKTTTAPPQKKPAEPAKDKTTPPAPEKKTPAPAEKKADK